MREKIEYSIKTIAIHFANLGPYHLARLESAVEVLGPLGWRVVAFEIAGSDENYGWVNGEGRGGFERVTVFPNAAFQRIGGGRLKKGIQESLDELKPSAMAIAGWGTPDARLCLRWCKRNGVKAIVMSETRAADGQRVWWREWFKSRIVRQFDAGLCGGESHRRYLVELGIPEECVALGYNVVDNDFFAGAGREAPVSRRSEVGDSKGEESLTTNHTNLHERGEEFLTTDKTDEHGCGDAGQSLADQAGAVFSNPSQSELGRDFENSSLIRSADNPASKLATRHSSPVTAPEALPQPYFLASCRFIRRKNVERLIQAYYLYATLNKGEIWPLVLLGDGDLRGELIARARELGLRIADGTTESAAHPTTGLHDDGRLGREDVLTTNHTKIHENLTTDYTDEHGYQKHQQGGAQGTCAGASESDSLASELADSLVSESLTRSANGPAFALDSGPSSLDSSSALALDAGRVRQWNADHIPTGSTLDPVARGAVIFAGWRQIEELAEIYQRAGAFVHPALEEPWGLVINEAMAAGLPVLSSRNVGAAEELVREADNGFLFDPRDSYQIARYMGLISRLPLAEREAMGRKSREILEAKAPKRAFGLGLKKLLSPNER